ncbi:SLAP domain-containing protein [Lactobacillus sp. ESL0785]|uniref:SLAP domain-containing protein n=1 Tax=Lactobacillus sp. ESL0785 TaxID=2983232 RepID=UPI0023F812D2|nr:SLAP domain-containing protein [Lactobacillus sp. ESL0785]WEV70751.1 SLAP domain-containing protein [Lactobacillus sp. ESL0785]
MKIKKLITTVAIGVGLVTPIFGVSQHQVINAASINSSAKKESYGGVTYLYKMLKAEGIKYNKFTVDNKIHYRKGKPEGIVIHETATPNASAHDEAIYFNRTWQEMDSYVHAFVDHKHVIQMTTPKYGVWGAGPVANNRFFQIELCEENSRKNFVKSVNNDAIYAAKILHRYHLQPNNAVNDGKGTIWSHHAVSRFLGGTNHTDPDGYFAKWGYSMGQFYHLIKYYYNMQDDETDSALEAVEVTPNPIENSTSDNAIAASASQASTNKQVLMHDAYIYDKQGKRTAAKLQIAGSKVTVVGSEMIKGRKYLQVGDNEYVVASNINGVMRHLTHNAYVYDTTGLRVQHPTLKYGQKLRTYGSQVKIGGTKYYQINVGEFVKARNF